MYFNKIYIFSTIIFSIFIIIFLSTCRKDPVSSGIPYILSDNLITGDETIEVTQDIGTEGGSIIISNAESVLYGLEIIVPANSYSDNRTYTISSSPVIEHTLGEYFNPSSPMITIKNGGGYSDMPIKIKVPIEKGEEEFAMGFLYDEITGVLEPLPVVDLNENYIILETRHFALSNINSGNGLGKILDINPIANLIVSTINESILTGTPTIDSGFAPGVDDWEFLNYGSYISPGGHCAGQSITAMWYYYEKNLKGEPSLFHHFDTVNNDEKPQLLWQDNPYGYRFASTIQEDFVWDSWISRFQQNFPPDILIWKTFIYAMLLTGNPQFVGIVNTQVGGGHAMIVYKINTSEGKLYIADPNYPNNRAWDGTSSIRFIEFNGLNFKPYSSSAKVGDAGKEYDKINFYAANTFVNWTQIGERWKEFENKTIGEDRFKNYDLYIKTNSNNIQIIDGMDVNESNLKIFCKNENIPGFLPGTDRLQRIEIYDSDGNLKSVSDGNGIANINLVTGENKLGIYVCGYVYGINGKPDTNKYYDFKWVTVNNVNTTSHTYTTCEVEVKYLGQINEVVDYDNGNSNNNTYWGNYGFTFSDPGALGGFTGNTYTYDYVESFDNGNSYDIHFTLTLSSDKSEIVSLDYNYTSGFEGNAGTSETISDHNIVSIPLQQFDSNNNEAIYYVGGEGTCSSIGFAFYSFDNVIFDVLHSTKDMIDYMCDQNSYIRVTLK